MVQIIQMPQKRTIGQAIGEGFGEGFSRGVDAALQDISYEKRLSIQSKQQLMLEEQREARQDQKILRAATVMAESKGMPDVAPALFSMEKASPGFLAKVNEQWAPADWKNLDQHFKQYSQDQINRTQQQQPPPVAQTGGNQANAQQSTRSAIQSTNINPRDPLINQQQMTQPGPNMMPPSPFPDVNRARTAQAIAPQQQSIQEQISPQGQQRAPIAPVGPATPPEETPYDQMTYKQKVAYNNENYPRKRAVELNKIALEEENLKYKQKKDEREEAKAKYELEKDPREYSKKLDEEYAAILKKRPIYKIMEKKAVELQPNSTLKKYLMERYHLAPGMLLNPTEEVLEKVSQQLLRGISSDYKGRILQSEVENYIKSNPSLLNTPEGMQKLSRISMALDNYAEKRWKLKNEIVKEARKKGERLPEDLELQVLEKASGFADESYDEVGKIMEQKGVQGTLDLEVGKKYDTLPPANQAGKNAYFTDTETGKRYVSDGQKWRRVS